MAELSEEDKLFLDSVPEISKEEDAAFLASIPEVDYLDPEDMEGLPNLNITPKDEGMLPRMMGEEAYDWQQRIERYKEVKALSPGAPHEISEDEAFSKTFYPIPTAEEEALQEDYLPPMIAGIAAAPIVGGLAGVVGLAGLAELGPQMTIGTAFVRGIARGLLMTGSEIAIRPAEEYAAEIHPYLRPLVGIVGGMGLGLTFEALGEEILTKALTKTAPRFWQNHFLHLKSAKLISKDIIGEMEEVAKQMDLGDPEAILKAEKILRAKAHGEVLSDAGKELKKLENVAPIKLPKTKKFINELKEKATLEEDDYMKLAAIAERDAVASYEQEFVKLKKTIIDDAVKRESFPEGTKLASKKRLMEAKYQAEFDRIYRDEILLRSHGKQSEYLEQVLGTKGKPVTLSPAYRTGLQMAAIGDVIKEVKALQKTTGKIAGVIERITTKKLTEAGKTRLARLHNTYRSRITELREAQTIKNKSLIMKRRLASTITRPHKDLTNEFREQIANFVSPMFKKPTKQLDETMWQFLARKYSDEFSIGSDIMLKRFDDMIKSIPSRTHNINGYTFEQLQDIDEFAKAFTFVGKQEKLINYKFNEYDLNDVVAEIKLSAQKGISRFFIGKPKYTKSQLEEIGKRGGVLPSAADLKSGFLSNLKRMEPIVRQLDGFKDFGPAWKQIFNKAAIAEVQKQHMGKAVFTRYHAIFKAHKAANKMGLRPGKYWSATSGNLVGKAVDKESAIVMALNSGHRDNMEAMLKGLQVNEDEMTDFLETALNESDWKLVNDIHDALDELFPFISKTYKEMTGMTLQKLKGGRYYPVIADRKYMDFREGFEDLFVESNPARFKASVERGFTNVRVGGVKALKLSLKPLTQHVEDVVHMSTHWKPINEIQRLVNHADFEKVVRTTMGDDIYTQFDPWLKNLARPGMTAYPDIMVEKTFGKLRRNVTTVALGAVPKVGVKQTLSLITALPEVGHRNTMASLAKMIMNPADFTREIAIASPEMAYRAKTWQREIAEMAATYTHRGSPIKAGLARLAFGFIHLFDRMTSSVVWHAGYLKGLDDFAGDANRAANYANMAVRKTQPASAAKDLPRIMRSGELNRSVTMFYSYYSVYHNQATEIINRGLAGNMSIPKAFATLSYLAMAPTISMYLAGVVWNGMTGRPQEEFDLKEFSGAVGTNALSGVPILRDAASAAMMGYDYRVSPIEDVGTEFVDTGVALMKAFDADQEFTKYDAIGAAEFIGYMTNLPSRQAITTILGAQRLMDGETDDWTEMIMRPKYKKGK